MIAGEVRRLLAGLGMDPDHGLLHHSQLGVGIDVEEVARWHDPAAALFTEAEHRHCQRMARPAESYAGRWCAKEAVLKALSPFLTVGLRDIEIGSTGSGAPSATVRARWRGDLRVSIAHSPAVAVAVAIAVRDTRPL